MAQPPAQPACRRPVVCLILGLLIFTALALYLWPFAIDDAYISARYARNLASGHGLAFSPCDPPSEGYSNFIFVLLVALITSLGGEAIIAAKTISLICGYLTILIAFFAARLIAPKHYSAVPLLCGAAFPLALWSVGGMATSFMALVVVLWLYAAALLFAGGVDRAALWLLAVTTAVAPLIRPEAILLIVIYVVVLLWWGRLTGRRIAWLGPLIVFLLLCGYELWRISYFGRLLPLPFYVKVEVSSLHQKLSGILYLHKFLWQYGGGAIGYLAVAYGLMSLWGRSREQRMVGLALLAAAPWLLFVLLVGSDWMPQYRFLVPTLAPIYILLIAAVGRLSAGLNDGGRLSGACFAAAIAVVLVGSAFGAFGAVQRTFWHSCRTEQIAFHASATQHLLDEGEWLRERGGPALTVAALDVGAVGYVSDACIIDIHGLTSPDLAGRDRDYVVRYILARKPDYIQVYAHPLLDAPEFKSFYTRVPGIAWHLYQRKR